MDKDELERLRTKYGSLDGGEMFDPKFRHVADKIFSNGTRLAPYSGIPTFSPRPTGKSTAENPDFGDLQVAIIGVPMDLGVTNRQRLPLRPEGAAHHRAHRPLQSCAGMRADA